MGPQLSLDVFRLSGQCVQPSGKSRSIQHRRCHCAEIGLFDSVHSYRRPSESGVFPILDQPGVSDPPNSVYRSQWAAALATAFGNNTPHFYDMDNEIDIWGGTHFDVHPNPSGYDELRDTY